MATSTKMPENFNRAERLLNRLVGDKVMTPTGKDWLVAAIDPFHDTELKNLQGWPDVETGYSVVRKVKQQITLVAPNAAPFIGNNWDLFVQIPPTLDTKFYSVASARTNNTFAWPNTPTSLYGGCQAWAIKPGTNWAPFAASVDTVSLGVLEINSPFGDGVGRLIGCGFEMTNTTSELYKQGSCTVFKQMSTGRDPVHLWGLQGANTCQISATILRIPPVNLAGVTLLPGSRTWAAKEGAYVVSHFHSNENTPYGADYNVPVFTNADDQTDITSNNALYVPQMAAGAIATSLTPNPCHLHPIHTSGAYFSGLSNQSSFILNLTYYYETFPTQSENDILVLATPSACFDPVALEIYSHALSTMPPGCMVKDNPAGEWFADVVDKVSNMIGFIPHPIAQALSGLGKAGVAAYRDVGPVKATPNVGGTRRNNTMLEMGRRSYVGKNGKTQVIQGPLTKKATKRRRRRLRAEQEYDRAQRAKKG